MKGKQQPPSIPSQILGARVPSWWESKGHALSSSSSPTAPPKDQQQLWVYEGALYDPLDGRRVASVKGLELVRPLEDTRHLAIDALLKDPRADYEDSQTLWSQKIFCYTTTGATTDHKGATTAAAGATTPPSSTTESILASVRVRPRSPRKEVPLDQAVAVYETATTFVSRKPKRRTPKGTISEKYEDDEELLVHSEWPNGQTVWGEARDCNRGSNHDGTNDGNHNGSMDFTVFAKLRNKNSPLYAPDLIPSDETEASGTAANSGSGGDVIVSPKRAALVQFGSASGTMETKHKFGARETYSYRNLPSHHDRAAATRWNPWSRWWNPPAFASSTTNPTLHYTRYGEGPPFYAPGRMCMLELRGRPVESLREVGPLLRSLVVDGTNTNRPPPVSNFHWREGRETTGRTRGNSPPTTASGNLPPPVSLQEAWNLRDDDAPVDGRRRRRQPSMALGLAVSDDDDQASTGTKRLVQTTRRRALAAWNRLRASTRMEAGP